MDEKMLQYRKEWKEMMMVRNILEEIDQRGNAKQDKVEGKVSVHEKREKKVSRRLKEKGEDAKLKETK